MFNWKSDPERGSYQHLQADSSAKKRSASATALPPMVCLFRFFKPRGFTSLVDWFTHNVSRLLCTGSPIDCRSCKMIWENLRKSEKTSDPRFWPGPPDLLLNPVTLFGILWFANSRSKRPPSRTKRLSKQTMKNSLTFTLLTLMPIDWSIEHLSELLKHFFLLLRPGLKCSGRHSGRAFSAQSAGESVGESSVTLAHLCNTWFDAKNCEY